ncbi:MULTISPECIES: AAA family ATPase [unclassified Mesorhizobium]|uniref:AAA family ATPase n=1 Tax=unclassified Mesorhizobium TaxID=325217 RepID=UPI000FCA329A|nr:MULTISPECIES: AAA family ATPase [unclassified Mesorhizobium]RUV24872.1 hypothetical protein EOA91_10415 [Mesorhizobium sp. M1A.F.Ca.IN.022.04.1.1]RWG33362.1 MAG: hypothetical protein EOQ60_11680 [Mesorhizobium sp.]
MTRDANDIHRNEGVGALREIMDANRRKPFDDHRASGVVGSHDDEQRDGASAHDRRRAMHPPRVRLLNYREYRQHLSSSTAGGSLIKGLVRVGTLISMNGRPGAGKTALLIEIARCLDAGEPFLGRETKQAVVVYIAAEDEIDVLNRVEAQGLDTVMIVVSEEGVPLTKPDRAVAIVREAIRQARERFPGREVFIPFDTLRAGLDGQSVLDDRFTSPALNKLRKLAEDERVVIAISNHTNRENPKQTKGETLEAVVALELILLETDGGWFELHVGKNRAGPGRRQIGRLRYTSIDLGDVEASVVDEIVAVDGVVAPAEKVRKLGGNQALVMSLIRNAVLDHGFQFRPFGVEGPEVKAVKEALLREMFIKRKAGDNRADKRRSFDSALNRLLERYLVRGESADGEGVIWHVKKEAEMGK